MIVNIPANLPMGMLIRAFENGYRDRPNQQKQGAQKSNTRDSQPGTFLRLS
jgi:hypothetical protein